MPYIKVTSEQLAQVAAQITTRRMEIEDSSTQVRSEVEALAGANWGGSASAQYAALMVQWTQASAQLAASLDGMAALLSQASAAYQQTESTVSSSMGS